jgi:N-acetylglucosamine kinase-like BadF-type ATPase
LSTLPPEKRTLLGVDIGNTKTHALLTDLKGRVLGFTEGGCGSYEVLGPDGYAQNLKLITSEVIAQAGVSPKSIAGMGFGLAGYDWPSETPIMAAGITALSINAPFAFDNDVMIGLIAGAEPGWGVAVDAGTGNNVRGRDAQGRTGRITGNSARFGEFGGASELVILAVIAVTHAWTSRGPATALTRMLMDYAEVDSEEKLIEGLAMAQIHLSPILARDILQTAAEGDPVAQEIVQRNAHDLGLNVNAVIRQLGIQDQAFDVVLIGSLFNAGEQVIKPLRETIYKFSPKARLNRLSVPPVVGAVLLGAEACGISPGQIRPTLIQSTASKLTPSDPSDLLE